MLQSIRRQRQAVASAPLVEERVERCGGGLAMPDGVGEPSLLGLEAIVLPLDGGDPLDLLDLMAQQVDLPRPSALVAAEPVEAFGQLAYRPTGAEQLLAVDTAVAVQRAALGTRPQQGLLGVLAVHLHEGLAELGQSAGGGERAVDRGAGATGRGHRAPEHPLGVADGEEPLDDDLLGSRPHPGRVGTSPAEEPERFDDHGLAGSGLAGHGDQPSADGHPCLGDHPEVAHRQLDQHRWPS